MSLLGKPEPVYGWTPERAEKTPEHDVEPMLSVLKTASYLLHRGKTEHALGQNLAEAYHHFRARLAEGRREAAEVRYALGLPMESTLGEVLEAIKRRSA